MRVSRVLNMTTMMAATLALWLSGSDLRANDAALEQARELYQATRYAETLKILVPVKPKTAVVYELLGRAWYGLEKYKDATEALEAAVKLEPRNAVYWDWLGKAYGMRADTSSIFTAPRYASRARQHFEKAVEIDPRNLEAVDDLFEYYLEAPGFLGGGKDKAARLAETIREIAPVRYEALQARRADKDEAYMLAEQHWRRAVELDPEEAGPVVNLAKFLGRRGEYEESDELFEQAFEMAPEKVSITFERAKIYAETERQLDEARRLLEEYLRAQLTPDDPSRPEAQKLLKDLPRR